MNACLPGGSTDSACSSCATSASALPVASLCLLQIAAQLSLLPLRLDT